MHATSTGPTDAPAVLLLHGAGVAGWMWNSLRDRLASTHRVIVPDLPGHGRSAVDPYISHEATIEALRQLIRTEVPDRPLSVVGFSLGAQLAVLLASDASIPIARAAVVSAQATPLPFTRTTLALLGITAPLARRRWFAALQAKELFIPENLRGEYLRTSATVTRQTLVAAVGANLRFELPTGWSSFAGPSLVMVGSRERPAMIASARALHEALPASRLEIVDGCGHGIPFQRADWFDTRIADWLTEPAV